MKIDLTVNEMLIIIRCIESSTPAVDLEKQTLELHARLTKILLGI
jgi:hypothetical protein